MKSPGRDPLAERDRRVSIACSSISFSWVRVFCGSKRRVGTGIGWDSRSARPRAWSRRVRWEKYRLVNHRCLGLATKHCWETRESNQRASHVCRAGYLGASVRL